MENTSFVANFSSMQEPHKAFFREFEVWQSVLQLSTTLHFIARVFDVSNKIKDIV